MSNLKHIEKRALEDLFGMASGYVLDYSNASFSQLFSDTLGINIYDELYADKGNSKANRLRTFWDLNSDLQVAKVTSEMLDVWEYLNPSKSESPQHTLGRSAVERLIGTDHVVAPRRKEEFLRTSINIPELSTLKLDSPILAVLQFRIQEVERALNANAPLSVIFLCGSILEGALLGTASNNPKNFNQSNASPKTKEGKVKQFQNWTLSELIDVAADIGLLKLDVKKFSHVLRDFRNYIHPYEQMASGFNPTKETSEICFQVLKAALSDLSNQR